MTNQNKAVKKFGITDKLGYMFGDLGNDLTFVLAGLFLLKFYTDVVGVSAVLVGSMMMIVRIVDAFVDVTVGQIIDRSKPTAKGKFTPWLRRVCGPVAVSSVLIYATWLDGFSMSFKVFWMFFSYTLWSICYSGINIPYGSMASAISAEPKERASLSNWRTIGSTLGVTIIGAVFPLFVYYANESGKSVLSGNKLFIASIVCSVIAVFCYLICYAMTTERVKLEQVTEKFSLTGLISGLVHNRSLIGIVVGALFLLLTQLSLGNMGAYIYPNYFGNAAALSVSTLLGTIITFALSPFIVKLSEAVGKKEMVVISSLFSACALILAFILHTRNLYVWFVLYACSYVGIAVFALVCWAMITDVIDDTEIKTRERSDGTIYSIYSFSRKLGQACSAGLTGGLLSIIGYNAATAFDPEITDGIYNITCLVPAGGFILMALSISFLYPLNKKRVHENAAQIKLLHEKK